MLKILRRIVQEVNAAKNLSEALAIMVNQVKETIQADACAVYLVDQESGDNVLIATEGLNPDMVTKIRLKPGQGIVGLVAERGEPINLDDAPKHPRFFPCPDLGEERYRALLGVPIIHQRDLLGVLLVQQEESRRFDEEEEAFLVTLSAQLSGVIAHARATGAIPGLSRIKVSEKGRVINGIPGAAGVAIGKAVVIYPLADLEAVPKRKTKKISDEIRHIESALAATREEIEQLGKGLVSSLPKEEQSLFEAYLRILDSVTLIDDIRQEIQTGIWAQSALKNVIKRHVLQFEAMDDPYLQERATDLKDLGRRILSHLQASEREKPRYPKDTILVGEEITASALAEVPEGRLVGVVSVAGSGNSHVAILARALGIPTVMGAETLPIAELEGKELIIDGYYGQVYIAPTVDIRREFKRLVKEEKELDAELQVLRRLPAKTLDGHVLSLYVNTGLMADVGHSWNVGAEGVGLYRTEIPYMIRDRFPTEEEQYSVYKQMLKAFAPRPVTMRTLDIGGDKPLTYFPVQEKNPFLGWRGIRITLDHPEVFLLQVRAMLRANIGLENLQIMLPMVSNIAELEAALQLIAQAHMELLEDGIAVKLPEIGVMIEVPSAVYQAGELAQRVSFLSVGSNDLTQYLLAVDRNNSRVANLYDSLHPAVLRALNQVVISSHQENKTVSICGEMAGDPLSVVLLLGMGFDVLSMSATNLPRVKWIIRKFTMQQAQTLLKEVLRMDDSIEIRGHMELALEEAGLGGLIRAGK